MPDLIDAIDEVFATKPLAEWGRIYDAAGLIWGPASTLSELANDPQAAATGLFPDVDHPSGTFRTVAIPLNIKGADIGPRGLAPDVGQHTAAVLQSIGLTPGELSALAAAGVIGPSGLADDDLP
jgi:crotonobetainyl-CoA:carnitine CoA-transferase CaiB-like acyl-CoA transferase